MPISPEQVRAIGELELVMAVVIVVIILVGGLMLIMRKQLQLIEQNSVQQNLCRIAAEKARESADKSTAVSQQQGQENTAAIRELTAFLKGSSQAAAL